MRGMPQAMMSEGIASVSVCVLDRRQWMKRVFVGVA